jgi:hypothetical protein
MELGIRNPVLDPVLANKIKIGSSSVFIQWSVELLVLASVGQLLRIYLAINPVPGPGLSTLPA